METSVNRGIVIGNSLSNIGIKSDKILVKQIDNFDPYPECSAVCDVETDTLKALDKFKELKYFYSFLTTESTKNKIKTWANYKHRKNLDTKILYNSDNNISLFPEIVVSYHEDMYSCGLSIKMNEYCYSYLTLTNLDGQRDFDKEYFEMLERLKSNLGKI